MLSRLALKVASGPAMARPVVSAVILFLEWRLFASHSISEPEVTEFGFTITFTAIALDEETL
jgi:hypothetical protein